MNSGAALPGLVGDVLLTGSNGFLGRHVSAALTAAQAGVRPFAGPPDSDSADICDLSALTEAAQGCCAVVHLAGPPGVARSWTSPAEFARVHVQGTATVIEACRDAGIATLIHVSSAEIYGCVAQGAVTEDSAPTPLSPYGICKLAAEQLIFRLAPTHGIRATILRPFSLFGPGADPNSLIQTILACIDRDAPIALSNLRPVRDYCFVTDFADAVVASLARPAPEKGRVLNIASGRGISVGDLAALVRRVYQSTVPIIETGAIRPMESEIFELVANIEAASHELDWRPRIRLEEALHLMRRPRP